MASKTSSSQKGKNAHNRSESAPEAARAEHRVLRPREYYYERHPWFGSQIHYTIDVFRQLIRDVKAAKANKQPSPKDGG